jgi:hypothetical protein
MFELQKPKTKPTRPLPQPQPLKIVSKPIEIPPPPQPPKILSKPIEIPPLLEENQPSVIPPDLPSRHEKELDWGDDDGMSFDAVSKFMNDTVPPIKPLSPPRASKSLIQFDTQELEFVTDEQLLKSTRTFHTSPSKETEQNENNNKDEHLRFFWFDAYEDPAAQPGKRKILRHSHKIIFIFLGKIFLFGKTPLLNEDKSSSKTFVSVCLIIDNIPKQVFFVPKTGVKFFFYHFIIHLFYINRVQHRILKMNYLLLQNDLKLQIIHQQ